MRLQKLLFILALIVVTTISVAQTNSQLRIALLKYSGGGDWYANPSSLPNLIAFCNNTHQMNIYSEPDVVEPSSPELFNYPFVHMTGHGNVVFSDYERENLRKYLMGGGFLHIDDNYGMDQYIRPEIQKLFPDKQLIEIGFSHEIFHGFYNFSKGMPKVHEHDNQSPQAFGIFHQGRLILLYTFETDLGDGWEDSAVHGDSQTTRNKALQMGVNIIQYAFSY